MLGNGGPPVYTEKIGLSFLGYHMEQTPGVSNAMYNVEDLLK